jgi:hypothetical protein
MYLPAADSVGIATASTERVRVDSTGNFIIGTTAALLSATNRGNITLNGASDSVIAFGVAGAASGYIYSTATNLDIDATSNRTLNFRTFNLQRMRIHASGGVSIGNTTDPNTANLSVTGTIVSASTIKGASTIGVGNATPSTSGAGVSFPATQSASTDANTLDDYEEGTWTPSLGGTATYNTQSGTYTKIGRQVTVNFVLDVSAIGTGSVSTVSNLPFTVFSTNRGSGGVGYVASPATAYVSIYPVAVPSGTNVTFICSSTVGAWTNTGAVFGTGTVIAGTLTYFV